MNKEWESCPRCESKKVKTRGKGSWFLLMVGSGGIFIWLGFIFPFFWFLSIALIILSPLSFIIPKVNQCQECNYAWKVEKKKVEA